MQAKKKRLGEILVENQIIDEFQLKNALAHQKQWGRRLGETLVELGFISENSLIKILSKYFNIPSVNINKIDIPANIISLLSRDIAQKYWAIPLALKTINNKKQLVVAMSDPTNLEAIDEMQFTAGMQILPMVSTISSIEKALHKYYLDSGAHFAFPGERSGISMLAKRPGDSRIQVIRRGEEEVVRLEDQPEEPPEEYLSAEDDAEVGATATASSTPPSEEEGLFSSQDLAGLDQVLQDDTHPVPDSTAAATPSASDSASQQLIETLADKGLLQAEEKEALLQVTHPLEFLCKMLFSKQLLTQEELDAVLDRLAKPKES